VCSFALLGPSYMCSVCPSMYPVVWDSSIVHVCLCMYLCIFVFLGLVYKCVGTSGRFMWDICLHLVSVFPHLSLWSISSVGFFHALRVGSRRSLLLHLKNTESSHPSSHSPVDDYPCVMASGLSNEDPSLPLQQQLTQ
jgi:hypothetical protein